MQKIRRSGIVIGLYSQGFTVAGNGLIQLPQAPECRPKVVMRLGEIGFDGEGL